VALAYFAGQGAENDFISCLFSYPFSYGASGLALWPNNALAAIRSLGVEQGVLWLAALAGLLASGLWGSLNRRLLLAWLLAAGAGAALSGKFYPHYFLALVPPMACLAALGLRPLWEMPVASYKWRNANFCWLGLVLCWFATSHGVYIAEGGAERSFRMYGLRVFGDAPAAAEVIRRVDPGGNSLWIWGSEPELYFLSGRRPATRFLYNYPFTGEAPAIPGAEEELLASLKDPALKIIAMPYIAALNPKQPLQALLARELNKKFAPAGRSTEFLVGIRRHVSRPGPGPRPVLKKRKP
jgi:hypothetical protein